MASNSGLVAITVALIGAGATVATAWITSGNRAEKREAAERAESEKAQPVPPPVETSDATIAAAGVATGKVLEGTAKMTDATVGQLEAIANTIASATTAEPTPPPPVRASAFTIAGEWHAPDHSPLVANQDGNQFALASVPVGAGAMATGVIQGSDVLWDFIIATTGVSGRCGGKVASDGLTIGMTCVESTGATYPYELHRPGSR